MEAPATSSPRRPRVTEAHTMPHPEIATRIQRRHNTPETVFELYAQNGLHLSLPEMRKALTVLGCPLSHREVTGLSAEYPGKPRGPDMHPTVDPQLFMASHGVASSRVSRDESSQRPSRFLAFESDGVVVSPRLNAAPEKSVGAAGTQARSLSPRARHPRVQHSTSFRMVDEKHCTANVEGLRNNKMHLASAVSSGELSAEGGLGWWLHNSSLSSPPTASSPRHDGVRVARYLNPDGSWQEDSFKLDALPSHHKKAAPPGAPVNLVPTYLNGDGSWKPVASDSIPESDKSLSALAQSRVVRQRRNTMTSPEADGTQVPREFNMKQQSPSHCMDQALHYLSTKPPSEHVSRPSGLHTLVLGSPSASNSTTAPVPPWDTDTHTPSTPLAALAPPLLSHGGGPKAGGTPSTRNPVKLRTTAAASTHAPRVSVTSQPVAGGSGGGTALADSVRQLIRHTLPDEPVAAAAVMEAHVRKMDADRDGIVRDIDLWSAIKHMVPTLTADDIAQTIVGLPRVARTPGCQPSGLAVGGSTSDRDVDVKHFAQWVLGGSYAGTPTGSATPTDDDSASCFHPELAHHHLLQRGLEESRGGDGASVSCVGTRTNQFAVAKRRPKQEQRTLSAGWASPSFQYAQFRASWESKWGAPATKELVRDLTTPPTGPTWTNAAPSPFKVLHMASPPPTGSSTVAVKLPSPARVPPPPPRLHQDGTS